MSCPLCKPYTLILILAGLAPTLFGFPFDVIGLAVMVLAIIISFLNSIRKGGAYMVKTPPKETT